MTTKEFIKILQEADPEGNGHIRMPGGIPYYADMKEGYWDGSYSYIDENGNYVISTKGYKVDIVCLDIESFVDSHFKLNDHDNWNKIKNMFKFEYTSSNLSSNKEKEESILKHAKEEWDIMYEIYDKSFKENITRSLSNSDLGWTWFQNKLVDTESGQHHYYTWKIYDENMKEQGSCLHNNEAVYKSGLFKKLDNNKKPGYYEWVKK